MAFNFQTIFQLYRSSQFYWWRKLECPEKPFTFIYVYNLVFWYLFMFTILFTCIYLCLQSCLLVFIYVYNLVYLYLFIEQSFMFELTTLVVIGTDCIGSCKSNYHTITTANDSPLSYYDIPPKHYVIKFVCDLRHVVCFLRALQFPPPIKLTATI
jgi:hypothetical protein